jgi:hypothetical protein
MAAPTATPTAGAATISATGESNGVLVTIDQFAQNPRLRVGVAGTFTGATLAARGRLLGLTNYYPLPGKALASSTPVADSTSISLTDSTNAAFEFDVSGCDRVEIYCPAGTLTDFGVEVRQFAADAPLLNVVNLAVANAQTVSGNLAVTGTGTITSTSAAALTAGANGATNPVLKVNANTASVATGVQVTGAAAAGGVAIAAISSGTNEPLTLDAKGSGTITIGGTSTGNVLLTGGGGRVVVTGTLTAGGLLTCALQVATSGPLIYSGSGAPTISAAVKGSIYLRTDGSTTSTRLYVATDTSGTWTACTTAA